MAFYFEVGVKMLRVLHRKARQAKAQRWHSEPGLVVR